MVAANMLALAASDAISDYVFGVVPLFVLMGLLAMPAMMRAGYDVKLSSGTICAGGTLGTEIGVKALADGYTFTMVSSSYSVNATLYKLAFDPVLAVEEKTVELRDFYSIVFQHEIDHGEGLLISDIGQEIEIF